MSDALINALAQGSATAVCLGIVLAILLPRQMDHVERLMRMALKANRELRKQTKALHRLHRDLSGDLPRIADESEVAEDEIDTAETRMEGHGEGE